MSESLVVIPWAQNGLVIPDDARRKYEALAAQMTGNKPGFEDAPPPWEPVVLKIVQPVTTDINKPETAKPGDFFYKGSLSTLKRPLRGLVTYAWHSRVRFVQGADKRPSCSSENVDMRNRGKEDTSISVYGDACAACPYGDQPFTGGKQTNCNNVLNVIFIPESLESVFHIQYSKSSYTTGRQLTDMARATPKAWSRFYDLNTEVKKREKGTGLFAVPTVSPVSDVPVPAHLEKFAEHVCHEIELNRKTKKAQIRQRPIDIEERLSVDTLSTNAEDPNFKDAI